MSRLTTLSFLQRAQGSPGTSLPLEGRYAYVDECKILSLPSSARFRRPNELRIAHRSGDYKTPHHKGPFGPVIQEAFSPFEKPGPVAESTAGILETGSGHNAAGYPGVGGFPKSRRINTLVPDGVAQQRQSILVMGQ